MPRQLSPPRIRAATAHPRGATRRDDVPGEWSLPPPAIGYNEQGD
jgi:hypothetical protein